MYLTNLNNSTELIMIRIFIADDHAVIRQGIKLILRQLPLFSIIGEASDGEETVKMLETTSADVLLLDLDMPKMNGISVIKELKSKHKSMKILVLTMHPEGVYGINTLRFGAHGFVSKNADSEMLIDAIKKVHKEGVYMSNDLAQKVAMGQITKESKISRRLSTRETQVLKLLSSGKRNKEIAEELKVNEKTISTYKTRLMKKLHIDNIADLINYSRQI